MARVLVVEGEKSFSDALSYLLRKESFEVAVCPRGTEVCQNLRSRSDVPVIMLSARDTEVDKAVGLELGADDYVTKPFTWRELAARIQAVLYGRGTGQTKIPCD